MDAMAAARLFLLLNVFPLADEPTEKQGIKEQGLRDHCGMTPL